MFFYYLLGNSDLSNHAQLICLSMAQTYITIPTYSHYCTDHYTSLHKQTSRFPCDIESNEFQNWLSRPWTSIEFCQNLHQVLKKYGKWFLKMHGNLEISSRNTLSTFIIRPQYNQQYKYQHPAEIRVPTWSREYWFVKSVNLYRLLLQRNCFLQKMCFSFTWLMNWARPWITCLHIVHGNISYGPTHSLWGTMPKI